MNKILITGAALTLMCGSAFAQQTGAPAAAQNDMNKPGMAQPAPGTTSGGAMQNNNMGTTTGSSMGRPDASQQGAPTGAAVNSKGDSTEPGKVKDGKTR